MDLNEARSIVDAAHEAFIAMDEKGRVAYWNPKAAETFGWSREEAVGRLLAETIIPERHREDHRRGLERFLATGEGPVLDRRIEIEACHRDGREIPVELTITAQRVDGDWAFNAFLYDISERKRIEREREELLARVEAMARTDPLTGLANRRAWDEELRRELERARRAGHPVCVIMLDLDRFKDYNDEHGHQAGDRLLAEAGPAWRMCLRVTDTLARYGGEEFAALLPDCAPDEALTALERLRAATPSDQTVSAGIAYWDGEETVDALIGRADLALYEAKRQGRDRAVTAS